MILRKFQWFWWFLKKKLRKFQKSLKVWKPKKSHWLTGSSSDRLRGNCLQMSRRLQPPKNIENNLFTKGKFHVFDKNQCFSYGKSRGGCWRKWHPPLPLFDFRRFGMADFRVAIPTRKNTFPLSTYSILWVGIRCASTLFSWKITKIKKNKSENLLWNFWKASKNFKNYKSCFFHEKNVSPHVLSSQIVVFTKNEKVLLRVKDTPKS